MNDSEYTEQATDDRDAASDVSDSDVATEAGSAERPREFGGRKGPEPTRYGDWEKNGRCIDF